MPGTVFGAPSRVTMPPSLPRVNSGLLISYQSPSLSFDDPEQYQLPLVNWSPEMEHFVPNVKVV